MAGPRPVDTSARTYVIEPRRGFHSIGGQWKGGLFCREKRPTTSMPHRKGFFRGHRGMDMGDFARERRQDGRRSFSSVIHVAILSALLEASRMAPLSPSFHCTLGLL